MIELKFKARDVEELLIYWEKLGALIKEGYTSGTLLDGWNISKIYEQE